MDRAEEYQSYSTHAGAYAGSPPSGYSTLGANGGGGGGGVGSGVEEDEFAREYSLPSTSSIFEPQKTGFLDMLETSGIFSTKHEYISRFCLLKDDGFFWLANKKDKQPKGLICISDPGVSMLQLSDCELEITTNGGQRKYTFKSSTPDELSSWTSKLKMAKIMHGVGGSAFVKSIRKPAKQQSAHAQSAMSMPVASRLGGGEEEQSASRPPPMHSSAARAMASAMMGVRMPFGGKIDEDAQPGPPEQEDDSLPGPPPHSQTSTGPPPLQPGTHAKSQQPVLFPAFGSGLVSLPPPPPAPSGPSEQEEKLWTDMLIRGGMFTKYKYAKGQKRLIWCPASLDRILWGDESKKKIKGYVMVCDFTAVRDGCEGSKKKDLALTIVSATRLLELESMDSQQKALWTAALKWLIGAK